MLLKAVQAEATAAGCGKVTLEALEHNAPAQALYRELGFTFQARARRVRPARSLLPRGPTRARALTLTLRRPRHRATAADAVR